MIELPEGICYSPYPPKAYLPRDTTHVFFAKYAKDLPTWNILWLTQPALDTCPTLDKNKWSLWGAVTKEMEPGRAGRMSASLTLDDADVPPGMALRHFLTLPPLDFLKRLKQREWWNIPVFDEPEVLGMVEARAHLSAGLEYVDSVADVAPKSAAVDVVGNVAYAEFRGNKVRLVRDGQPSGTLNDDAVIAATGTLVDPLVDEEISDDAGKGVLSMGNGEVRRIDPVSANSLPELMIEAIKKLAEKLGEELISAPAFYRETGISEYQVGREFGSFTELAIAAGIRSKKLRYSNLTDTELMGEIYKVFTKEGRVVNSLRFQKLSIYGDKIYRKHYGSWSNALDLFKVWVKKNHPEFNLLNLAPTDASKEVNSPAEQYDPAVENKAQEFEPHPLRQQIIQNSTMPSEVGAIHGAMNIVVRLQLLEEKLSNSIARVERMGDAHASEKPTVRAAIDFIRQHPELFAAEIAELRAFLGETSPTSACVPDRNDLTVPAEIETLEQVVAWLATQEMVTVSDLRTCLLPLDLLPGAVIDDLNGRALDLTGDLALEEDGEKIIIAREVLAQVVSAW